MKKGFCAGFAAGFTTSELFHKLIKEVKQSFKDMQIPKETETICRKALGSYTETAEIDPKENNIEDEFLKN